MIPVIVLNYNGIGVLGECLDSLRKQSYHDIEVFVVDNASRDGSISFLKENYPEARIIRNKRNYGFAAAYNRAIKKTNSRFVALLNNDVAVDHNWMKALLDCFTSQNDVFACGSRILLRNPEGRVNHAGGMVSILGGGWDERFLESEALEPQKMFPYLTSCACGAAMMLDRNIFLELGGFDDDFFAYFEDTDICYRAWLSGYNVLHCPRSVAYHALSTSWGRKISQRRIYLSEVNRLQMALKDFQYSTLVRSFAALSAWNVERVLSYLMKRSVCNPSTLINADLWALRNLNRIWRKRVLVQSKRKLSDNELQARGLLVGLKEILSERARLNIRRHELSIPQGYI